MVDYAENRMTDTVAAIATPPGRGGVGIIRISGPLALEIGCSLTGRGYFEPRYAYYSPFLDSGGAAMDHGLTLYFPGPNSFTGEDILELHSHGSPVVLSQIMARLRNMGIPEAGPGEFSRRAFLNGRLDLSQAEGIAALIDAETDEAARAAVRTLEGDLGKEARELAQGVQNLRVWVEGSLDFPDDDIQELDDGYAREWLENLLSRVEVLRNRIEGGIQLAKGGLVVLAGLPNAGKSSLLNALSGRESAIVTEKAGTTRDVLCERIQIEGIPVEIVDTAGLRESPDQIEAEGVRRARSEVEKADLIVYLVDGLQGWQQADDQEWRRLPHGRTVVFRTKGDLGEGAEDWSPGTLSVHGAWGLQPLLDKVSDVLEDKGSTDSLGARERHRRVVEEVAEGLRLAEGILSQYGMGDLFAQEVAKAHDTLGAITGYMHTEDILDEVFSSFCVGK